MKIIQTKVMRKVDEDYIIVRHNPVRFVKSTKYWSLYNQWKHDRDEDKMCRVWKIGKYKKG